MLTAILTATASLHAGDCNVMSSALACGLVFPGPNNSVWQAMHCVLGEGGEKGVLLGDELRLPKEPLQWSAVFTIRLTVRQSWDCLRPRETQAWMMLSCP